MVKEGNNFTPMGYKGSTMVDEGYKDSAEDVGWEILGGDYKYILRSEKEGTLDM